MRKLSNFLPFAVLIACMLPTYAHADCIPNAVSGTASACGQAIVQGFAVNSNFTSVTANPLLEQIPTTGPVSVGAVGTGNGGIAGTAQAAGSFGVAHVIATADNGQFGALTFDRALQANVSSEAIFGFGDLFTLTTAATLHFSSFLDGSFLGDSSGSFAFGQVAFNLQDITTRTSAFSALISVNSQHPADSFSSGDVPLAVGDYSLTWFMDGEAHSFNGLQSSTADMRNTGTLFIDSDVALSFASGHDYSSNAVGAVPEPSTWAMMILGFAGVGFMAYRRKARPALIAA
jgi:PEP-CTERM motif